MTLEATSRRREWPELRTGVLRNILVAFILVTAR
jgi:hypothetical protein